MKSYVQGKVSDCGTYEELKDRGVDFTSFLNADEEEQDDVFSVKTMELSMSLRSLDAVAHGKNFDFTRFYNVFFLKWIRKIFRRYYWCVRVDETWQKKAPNSLQLVVRFLLSVFV